MVTNQKSMRPPIRPHRKSFGHLPQQLSFTCLGLAGLLFLMLGAGWMDYGRSTNWRESRRPPRSAKQWSDRFNQQWNLAKLPGWLTDNTISSVERRQRLGHWGITSIIALGSGLAASNYQQRKREASPGRPLHYGKPKRGLSKHGY